MINIQSKKTEALVQDILKSNKGNRIKIRFKPVTNAITIFLDYYNENRHNLLYYPTRIFGKKETERNDEIILLCIKKDRDEKTLEIIKNKNPFRIIENLSKQEFITYFEVLEKQRKDRPVYQSCLRYLKIYLNNSKIRFCDLTPSLFEGFKEFLLKKISVNTTFGYLQALRAVLNKAVREKILTESPLKDVKLKAQPVIKEYLSPEEISSIINLETKFVETKNAFLFSCFTGIRRGDMVKLTFDKIRGDNIYFIQGKTKKAEFLPLSEDALEIIRIQKEAHPDSDKVFHIGSVATLGRELRIILKELGINRKVTYHSSRHTFAVRSLESGIDSHDVKNFLGHRKIETTEVYLKFATSQKRNVIDRVPSLMNKQKQ
ncbi:MAG: site-specific integrase [FCB group bacterium]|jgi:integrase